MIKEEKRRLRVSNIYAHNAFMMLEIKSARLNDLQRFIKKQIKNVKNGELQFNAKVINNERGQQWLSFENIHASG